MLRRTHGNYWPAQTNNLPKHLDGNRSEHSAQSRQTDIASPPDFFPPAHLPSDENQKRKSFRLPPYERSNGCEHKRFADKAQCFPEMKASFPTRRRNLSFDTEKDPHT